jgi:hypothetical protein
MKIFDAIKRLFDAEDRIGQLESENMVLSRRLFEMEHVQMRTAAALKALAIEHTNLVSVVAQMLRAEPGTLEGPKTNPPKDWGAN